MLVLPHFFSPMGGFPGKYSLSQHTNLYSTFILDTDEDFL
jgi:hypothetical protein